MKKIYGTALGLFLVSVTAYATPPYTVLDAKQYRQTVADARSRIVTLLNQLKSRPHLDANARIAFIANQLADIPYLHQNAMGEGDWQPAANEYQPNAIHIKQNPVYRLDGLNCQTLVQVVIALTHSSNLSQFDKNYLKISYGAAGYPQGEIVHYFNRNNFTDADFNPVNQRNGWLRDVTSRGVLSPYGEEIHATITRQKWFLQQRYQPSAHIQVLDDTSGPLMLHRFNTMYTKLNFPHFNREDIVMSYLPKETLAIRQADNSFKPNQKLFDKIPTPAIAEIVRDPKRWSDYGIKIKDIIGSELTVSHLGLLYRQTFRQGELIYRKTSCKRDDQRKSFCEVTPITCQQKICKELMFTHATNIYHARYYWYETSAGNYVCSPHQPQAGTKYTFCNRVVSMPLFDYLTDYQSGYYTNMDVESIVGVHIEKLYI